MNMKVKYELECVFENVPISSPHPPLRIWAADLAEPGSRLGNGQDDLCDARKALSPKHSCISNLLCKNRSLNDSLLEVRSEDTSSRRSLAPMPGGCSLQRKKGQTQARSIPGEGHGASGRTTAVSERDI